MDLFIILLLIVVMVFIFRSVRSFIYSVAFIDILLRVLTFIKLNIGVYEIATLIDRYIPISLKGVIDAYATGPFNKIITWLYVICFIMF